MNDIRAVKFTNESPINSAIAEIIAIFDAANDGNSQKLFNTVREGNAVTLETGIADGEGVCLRIYRVRQLQQINTTPNFVFRKKVTLCIAPLFELGSSPNNITVPGFGGVEPIDYYRENLRRQAQKILEDSSLTGNLTSLSPGVTQYWNFGHQNEEIEMENNYLMEFEKQIPLKPGWYSASFLKIIEVDVR